MKIWFKEKTTPRMNHERIGKTFRKKSYPTDPKNSKNQAKLPHVNKKPLARKRMFVATLFSHSTLK